MENDLLNRFREHVLAELNNDILPFWTSRVNDQINGGFFGRITNQMHVQANAPKALILNARLLWAFSAAYRFDPKQDYLHNARRAFQYLVDYFWDPEYGGMYWLLDACGKPLDARKKIYGQAFAIYGLSEYYAACGEPSSLEMAIQIYRLIERHNYDSIYRGYFESSNRDWSLSEDQRLSEVDMNEVKSMNTHLHVLEAYTNLCLIWQEEILKNRLSELLDDFLNFILDVHSHHLRLFFDAEWHCKSDIVSFGHDIEGSWLLWKAANVVNDESLISRICSAAQSIVSATVNEGMNDEGGVCFERRGDGSMDTDVHWWVQVEAVVGLINAYQLTHNEEFFQAAWRAWQFIEKYLIDRENGEWFYKVDCSSNPDLQMLKVSEWKGPYHNSRACMEIVRRLDSLNKHPGKSQKE